MRDDKASPPSVTPDPLVSVTSYTYNPGDLQGRLDIGSGELIAIHRRGDPKGDSCTYTVRKARATHSEMVSVARNVAAIEQDLRKFAPRLSWFKMPPIETGDVVEYHWKDGSVFIARPRDSMYGDIPEEARALYSEIGRIESQTSEIGGRLYGDAVVPFRVGPDDPLAKGFERDWAAMRAHSLPKGRQGW